MYKYGSFWWLLLDGWDRSRRLPLAVRPWVVLLHPGLVGDNGRPYCTPDRSPQICICASRITFVNGWKAYCIYIPSILYISLHTLLGLSSNRVPNVSMTTAQNSIPSNPADDAGPRILGATIATTGVAILTVAARCYVRNFTIRNIGWDDYAMLLASTLVGTFEEWRAWANLCRSRSLAKGS